MKQITQMFLEGESPTLKHFFPFVAQWWHHKQTYKSCLLVYILNNLLRVIITTLLTCKSLSSMSYCQNRDFRAYLQHTVMDSRVEIEELPRA